MSEHDEVNHPKHYTSHPSGVECITVTEHMGFNLGNAVKYIWRADLKDGAEKDLNKAIWYIQRELKKRTKVALKKETTIAVESASAEQPTKKLKSKTLIFILAGCYAEAHLYALNRLKDHQWRFVSHAGVLFESPRGSRVLTVGSWRKHPCVDSILEAAVKMVCEFVEPPVHDQPLIFVLASNFSQAEEYADSLGLVRWAYASSVDAIRGCKFAMLHLVGSWNTHPKASEILYTCKVSGVSTHLVSDSLSDFMKGDKKL